MKIEKAIEILPRLIKELPAPLFQEEIDAVICTRLPIDEAAARLNRESPSGVSHPWSFDGEASNQSPCPDGQGKTHYRLFC